MSAASLLLVASLMLVVFGLAAAALLRADQQTSRVRARQEQVIAAYRLARPPKPSARRLLPPLRTSTLRRPLRRLFGMDPDRTDAYPLKIWLIAPPALCAGLAARWLLHGLLGPLAWLLLPGVALFVIRAVYRRSDAKRAECIYRQFPDALAMIIRAVRVGIPVTEALWAVSRDAEQPTASLFAKLYDQVGIGTPLDEALRDLAERAHIPEYRFFASAVGLQSQTGGGLTETLENLADVIRKRVALKARGLALAAEARTSAGVLAVLPIFTAMALVVLDQDYLLPLFTDQRGQTLLGCTIVWLCLGMLTMRVMIKRTLS